MNWAALFEHAEEWAVGESELLDALTERRATPADE